MNLDELAKENTELRERCAEQGKLLEKAIAERDELTVFQVVAMTAERDRLKDTNWHLNGIKDERLTACQQERDEYRKALEICKTEMQGDKWDALYIDTVLAKYPREEKP